MPLFGFETAPISSSSFAATFASSGTSAAPAFSFGTTAVSPQAAVSIASAASGAAPEPLYVNCNCTEIEAQSYQITLSQSDPIFDCSIFLCRTLCDACLIQLSFLALRVHSYILVNYFRICETRISRISVVPMTGTAIAIDDATATDTIISIKHRVFAANRKLYVRRQRLVYRPGPHGIEALADDKTLGGAGVARDGTAELDVLLADLTYADLRELGEQVYMHMMNYFRGGACLMGFAL